MKSFLLISIVIFLWKIPQDHPQMYSQINWPKLCGPIQQSEGALSRLSLFT